ncbi:MAG: hypothetical protein PCFJNLEI_00937 [Verrucomicrobiae bacterium]|nr:hypothetical protein [Verrucomicrobiae bacterium]
MNYQHLGVYSDLVAEAHRQHTIYPLALPGAATQRKVREVLGWCDRPEQAHDVRVERTWQKDGVAGEEITWSVGYGPRTAAWLLKPVNATGKLPAVLALHDHGGFKYYGKEKIADGPATPAPVIREWWKKSYGGRAWANALARTGFVVLVHDTFLWGSRKFHLEDMQQTVESGGERRAASDAVANIPAEVARYNAMADTHEHIVSKYGNILGASLPGIVAHEDRIALNYLRSRPEVDSVSCMGLSGGGNRAGMLRATAEGLKAAVVVGLMSTYPGLLGRHVATHTWMFFPFNWARYGDWPDLVACQAPAPLLVQYDLEDDLFTVEGMRAADARLKQLYKLAGNESAYTGQFYPGPHKFDLEMQAAAFEWLTKV